MIPAATPSSGSTAGRWMSLPSELLEQSCRRVGTASLVFASMWALGLFMANVVARVVETPLLFEATWPLPGNVIAVTGLLLSVAMMFVAGQLHDRPNLLLDVGLGFEVLTAFLFGLLYMWVPPVGGQGVSWICVVILVYPAIAPNTPHKIFVASMLAASMDLVGYGIANLRGVEASWTTMEGFWVFLPNYI